MRLLLILLCLAGDGVREPRLLWSRELPARAPAWAYTPKMIRDVAYAPAAAGGLVVVGGAHDGALVAFDAAGGEERWRFWTDGPIRTAPVADAERVYAASDDGRLYALDHAGRLLWSFRGGPTERKVLGHGRLVSAWPAEARPTLSDGVIFYVAGAWPVDGIFVHALEAATGKPLWTQSRIQYRPTGRPRVVDGTLFVHGHGGSGAYDVRTGAVLDLKPPAGEPAAPATPLPGLEGTVVHRAEGNGRIFAATSEGRLYAFGDPTGPPKTHALKREAPAGDLERAKAIAGPGRGSALVAGLRDGSLVEGLLRTTELHVVALEPDAARAAAVRKSLEARGAFDGHRLDVLSGPAALPPFFACLVASENDAPPEALRTSLRPYGGVWATRDGLTRREGPPPGADDWTHEYHDAANTLASADEVKAPLGLLWYGGPAADVRLYYDGDVDHQSGHGINPQPVPPQVVEGRMILQGPGVLAAVDLYTGALLWESKLPGVYTFGGAGGGLGIHSKNHPEPWRHPEALKAEVPPTERCRSSGFDMVSLPDAIYVGAGRRLLRFDPRSGRELSGWEMPGFCWGNLRASGDLLLATAFRPQDLADAQAGHDGNGGDWAGDRMPMALLVALDRRSGRVAWQRAATWGYVNRSGVAVGNGKVFVADLLMDGVLKKFVSAGRTLPAEPPSIAALDLATGRELWKKPLDVLVKALAYSEARDLLVAPCRNLTEWKDGRWVAVPDAKGKFSRGIPGRMRALRGADGSAAWEAEDVAFFDPHVLLGDLVVDRDGFTYDLPTGKRNLRTSPLTGAPEPWSFRKGGCNHLIAGRHLVTWRCAFFDLAGGSGVMKLAGMDAGCSPTLIPAGGVLSIANFGTHHKRNRMTACALVHVPENELWTSYATSSEKSAAAPQPVRRAGFDFTAPGDRLSEGVLWFGVQPGRLNDLKIAPKDLRWSEGLRGAASLAIPTSVAGGKLVPLPKGEKRRYTVRLEIEGCSALTLEGRPADPAAREHKGVEIEGPLDLTLDPPATLFRRMEVILE